MTINLNLFDAESATQGTEWALIGGLKKFILQIFIKKRKFYGTK